VSIAVKDFTRPDGINYEAVLDTSVCLSLPSLFGTQIASLLRHIVLLYVACLALEHIPTLSHKRHVFQKKKIDRKECVWIFSTTFV